LSPNSRGFRRPGDRSDRPEGLGSVLDDLLARRPWAGGMTLGELGRRWPEVVGERLGEETAPAGLVGGVLTVRASSAAWGAQVRFLAEEIRRRSNAVLGGERAASIRVVVDPGR
jgi:predicted nucleic acid-binding Zn ribbon protein